MGRPCCTQCCTTFLPRALFHYYYKLVGTIINVHRPNIVNDLRIYPAVPYGSVCFLGFWHRFQLFGVWGSELGIDAMCIDHLVHCYSGVPISCRLELGAVRWGPLAFESLGLTQRFPYRGDPGPPGRRFGPVDLAPTDSQFSFAEEHTLIRRPRRAVLREPVNAGQGRRAPVSEAIQEQWRRA